MHMQVTGKLAGLPLQGRASQDACWAERLTCCGGGQVETRINCPLSAMQTFWYRRLLLKDSKMLKSLEAEFSSDPNVQVGPPVLLPRCSAWSNNALGYSELLLVIMLEEASEESPKGSHKGAQSGQLC